jgi:hypothetical protein
MVFVTARLTRNGLPLGSAILMHHVYDIEEPITQILGKHLTVVCGPHADYHEQDGVYTVELLGVPEPVPDLLFYNSMWQSCWEHYEISVY